MGQITHMSANRNEIEFIDFLDQLYNLEVTSLLACHRHIYIYIYIYIYI
jgi:hypothetical protein